MALPTFQDWLLAQTHRDDVVGLYARDCVLPRNEPYEFGPEFRRARAEYEKCRERLARGESCETFPRLLISEAFKSFCAESLKRHKATNHVSAMDYLHALHCINFRDLIEKRKLLYLDTNHWINLRHVVLSSRHEAPGYREVLVLLRKLVHAAKFLCPVSFPLFCELMKQRDETTRLATATLMDELSGGVCLQEPIQIHKLEFRRFVHKSTFGIGANDLREWFWTKVGYISGVQLPSHSSYDAETVNLIQKLSIDAAWSAALVHMAERAGAENGYSMPEILYADATNEDARWYRENRVSFKEAWAREKAHILRSNWDDFRAINAEIYQRYKIECDQYAANPSDTQFDPFNFPSIQVLAGVNAACLTSLKRFTQNDMFDFRHAALAVPYYDALFCDTPLANLLSKKPLQFASTYSVRILSKPDEMIQYLRGF